MSAKRITNFSMRAAELSDMSSLLLLTELALPDLALTNSGQRALLMQARAMLQSAIPKGTSYIALVEEDIIGFGGWSWEHSPVTLVHTAGQGVLYALLVHPRWRRRGIGRQIIKLCELTAARQSVKKLLIPIMAGQEGFPSALGYTFAQQADFRPAADAVIQMSVFSKSLNHA